MDTYKFDLGTGFHRTMGELTLVFSACLCLVCLLGGLLNWYLLRKKVDPEIMKGVITINLIVFGILFGLTVAFTFLLPIIQTGLIVLFLILSRFTMRKNNWTNPSGQRDSFMRQKHMPLTLHWTNIGAWPVFLHHFIIYHLQFGLDNLYSTFYVTSTLNQCAAWRSRLDQHQIPRLPQCSHVVCKL